MVPENDDASKMAALRSNRRLRSIVVTCALNRDRHFALNHCSAA